MSIIKFPRNHNNKAPHKNWLYAENSLVQLTSVREKRKKAQITVNQPRSQGSLLLVPTERERRRLGEKTWERGWLRTVVGSEGLAREGEGRRTPRPSFFAKRRLKSQLRRIFAKLLGSYQCGFCTQEEEAMSITSFVLFRPLYITGKSVSIRTSGKKEATP